MQSVMDRRSWDGNLALTDVLEQLLNGGYQLWYSERDDEIEAMLITQILQHPRKKILALPFIAGVNRDNWLPFKDTICRFARSNGCVELEGYFRPGWLRVLKGTGWDFNWTHGRMKL